MKKQSKKIVFLVVFVSVFFLIAFSSNMAFAAEAGDTELAKKTQNPVGDLISVPFQNNFSFGVGPDNDVQYVLNIQPIYPIHLNSYWNWINRLIIPVINQPGLAPGMDNEFGLGDIQYQGYLSPAKPGKWVWGIGRCCPFPLPATKCLGLNSGVQGPV